MAGEGIAPSTLSLVCPRGIATSRRTLFRSWPNLSGLTTYSITQARGFVQPRSALSVRSGGMLQIGCREHADLHGVSTSFCLKALVAFCPGTLPGPGAGRLVYGSLKRGRQWVAHQGQRKLLRVEQGGAARPWPFPSNSTPGHRPQCASAPRRKRSSATRRRSARPTTA
jgi:hypothetical protein